MDFFSITSGSSGNCICVGDSDYHVMIDAGISGKRIEDGMNRNGFKTSDMNGILITHEHIDHISGLGVLARRYGIPIYATRKTIDAIAGVKSLGSIDPGLFHPITAGQKFQIGSLDIDPIHISHDAADPVAYVISSGEKRVGVLTDLGTYDDNILEHTKDLDALLLEANHDKRMLEVGPYPYQLKMRILSDHGHLSNEKSGELLSILLNDGMKQVLLGHLSQENNLPELAAKTVEQEVTLSDTKYKGSDFPIHVASRFEPSICYEI